METTRKGSGAPFSEEWLRSKYIDEGLGCPQIGTMVNRDAKTVFYWLRQFSIQTRPRGANPKVHFRKGEQRRLGMPHSEETREKLRQARLADGHVPYLKDGKPFMLGRRGEMAPAWKGGVTPERQDFYRSDEWKAAVRSIWGRDAATCQRCGLKKKDAPKEMRFDIHHIVSFAVKHLRCEVSNLALLCRPCHLFVHSKANTSREFMG